MYIHTCLHTCPEVLQTGEGVTPLVAHLRSLRWTLSDLWRTKPGVWRTNHKILEPLEWKATLQWFYSWYF